MSDLPDGVVDRAEELTRRARRADDDQEAENYRDERDRLLDEHGFLARRKRDGDREVLVLHPEEWVVDGRVDVERVEDVSRGLEVPLSGPDAADDWDEVAAHNRQLADAVAADHGDPHGETARAFADFASNHYAKRIEDTTPEEVREFLTDYFPRNAFPGADQRAVAGESLRLVFEAAGTEPPLEP